VSFYRPEQVDAICRTDVTVRRCAESLIRLLWLPDVEPLPPAALLPLEPVPLLLEPVPVLLDPVLEPPLIPAPCSSRPCTSTWLFRYCLRFC